MSPTSWQKRMDAGSPPCSPQIPSLMFGLVFFPPSTAHPELVVHPFDGTDYEELHMAIKKIPMPHRERLIKKFFHGMTIIEIADEEGTTKQAVSKSINKALALLKISLQNG